MADRPTGALRHPDMREKKQVTVRMTDRFAKDLNLIFATYGITDATYVVRESVNAQAVAARDRLSEAPQIPPKPDVLELSRAEKWRLYNYSLTPGQYDAMLEAQGGHCLTCEATEGLVVDHDHACCPDQKSCGKCVRAILCNGCNTALGMAKEDATRLRKLADYIEACQADAIRDRIAARQAAGKPPYKED